MANKKTAEELRAAAKALIEKAKQQEQDLIKQAKELEAESLQTLGAFTVKYLSNEILKEELIAKADELQIKYTPKGK